MIENLIYFNLINGEILQTIVIDPANWLILYDRIGNIAIVIACDIVILLILTIKYKDWKRRERERERERGVVKDKQKQNEYKKDQK